MTIRILTIPAFSVTVGLIVGLAFGPLPGTGAFALALLAGCAAAVLWRSHRDRAELEHRMVRVPVHRVVRDEPLPRPPL